ncbi:MAG: 3'(2'),5'-bisphosphate nucleotidase CysQ [Bauldia sp.]|nr:3'(2'),5'-bisphosphate nucleotidase CysQ [Bauldia sp.]MCW5716987.1 3'(2'),5'-bisphosphate nucleotidase CysQ [Bauldia sp.]
MSARDLADDLALLADAVRAAADLALGFVGKTPKVWTKANSSPVTEVDIAVESLLADRLRAARPGYGWLSEETEDEGSRLTAPRTFIVDPIDGTRSFVQGGRDWTIPVAIVERGRPVVAALANPRRDEFYAAIAGGGATMNGRPIRVSVRRTLGGSTLAVSRRLTQWSDDGEGEPPRNQFYASLAYRLARVADGRLDGAAIKADAQDWDLAAADLLVHEAGGVLSDLGGAIPRYDRPGTSHPPLIAAPPALADAMMRILRQSLSATP